MSISRDFAMDQYRDDIERDGDVPYKASVGYGNPPKAQRFQKGQSGNPKGRPKGSGIRSALDKVLERKVPITIDGKRRKVPVTEAIVTQLVHKALGGDAAARRDFLKIADQAAQARAAEAATEKKSGGLTVLLTRFGDPEGCTGALELLGATVEVGDGSGQLKIQPWVVEAAAARGLKLTAEEEELVKSFTVTPEDVAVHREPEQVITRE